MVRTKNSITARQPLKKPYIKPKKEPQEKKEKSLEKKLYERYIKSEQFKGVKTIVHKRDNETCVFCGRNQAECMDCKTQLQVHHRSYEHLGCGGEEEAQDCILICGICHRGAHMAPNNLRRFLDKSPILNNWKKLKENDDLSDNKDIDGDSQKSA